MTLLEELWALAFASAPPGEANQAIAQARAAQTRNGVHGLSYEVALPAAHAADAFLLERALPKLVYFLDCRGAKLPHTPGIFVSLFSGERLAFIEAGAFAMALARRRGLDAAELVRRYGEQGAGDPPLLGG